MNPREEAFAKGMAKEIWDEKERRKVDRVSSRPWRSKCRRCGYDSRGKELCYKCYWLRFGRLDGFYHGLLFALVLTLATWVIYTLVSS